VSGERFDPMLGRARANVHRRMSRGGSVDDVDAEIIEPSGFSADEKAALWLYAWSYVPGRMQRRWADRQLQMVVPRS
jgi:hypothetical protein